MNQPQWIAPLLLIAATSYAGTVNTISKYADSTNLTDSAVTESSGSLVYTGASTAQLQLVGVSSGTSARLGQDMNGGFWSSDTNNKALRLLTKSSSGVLNEWARLDGTGKFSFTSNLATQGEVAIAPDSLDNIHSYTAQAGSQMHFRLSRSNCTGGPGSYSDGCDQSNLAAKDFMIVPYRYGMAIEYPSVLEIWVRDLSVHQNHQGCTDTDSCNAAANFWVGDELDAGGLYVTAHNKTAGYGDATQSYVNIAADLFSHTSAGSLQFQVRNTDDKFRFQSGPYKTESTVAQIDAAGNAQFRTTANNILSLGNFSAGGSIGTASSTVDTAGLINIAQSTSGKTLSLPNPTDSTHTRTLTIVNNGSSSFNMLSKTVSSGTAIAVVWNGSSWISF